MNRLLATTLFANLAMIPVAVGQNLVQNGSFEEYYNCPIGAAEVYQAEHWNSPFNQSADYFHSCSWAPTNDVPLNYLGYQNAVDGEGYMGMCTYKSLNPVYREFIQTELIEPLTVGVPVCLSFKLAAGGFGSFGPFSPIYSCAGLGMKFFVQTPLDWESYFYPNSAALYMEVTPTDTSQWYLLQGVYVPDSAYTQLVIGNLFADSLNGVDLLDTTGYGSWPYAYAFIDDVRVSYDLGFCTGTNVMAEAVAEEPLVFPNPFNDHLEILSLRVVQRNLTIELRNALGSLAHSQVVRESERMLLRLPDLPAGPYILTIRNDNNTGHTVPVFHLPNP